MIVPSAQISGVMLFHTQFIVQLAADARALIQENSRNLVAPIQSCFLSMPTEHKAVSHYAIFNLKIL